MNKSRWKKSEINILKKIWLNSTKYTITSKIPNRSWNAIILKACSLKLKRDITHINVNGTKYKNYKSGISKLHRLLEESNEAYYWAGFIAADGHINTFKHRLKITLSIKDKKHLEKFTKFINCDILHINKYKNTCWVSLQDKNIISQFTKKFKFCSYKTYNLLDPKIKNDDLFLSFMAGFIDGDGRVAKLHNRSDAHISIVGHKNSLPVFKIWIKRIHKLFPADQSNSIITKGSVPKLDSYNYARAYITNFEVVKNIKKKIIKLNIPYLERKWNTIDLTKISKYHITKIRRQKSKILHNKGFNRKQIAKKLNITVSATYRYF